MINKAILFLLLLSSLVISIHANKQTQRLQHLRNAKRSGTHSINTGHFEAVDHNAADVLRAQQGLREKDRITKLPGQPAVKFRQYGGYITVNQTAGRAFYYYFIEAQPSPSKKKNLPLLLWLNGGPGCSSLAYGAMQELGPFRVNSDGKSLYTNKFAWNKAANVLFLESPAGVGFSYSNTTSDYENCGDGQTATDNYVFLLNWLKRFPEYKRREFYISGESYAGHYVPQLAHTILYHNLKANKTLINLKGILIGNAVINDETDENGMYDYFASHTLISDENLDEIHKYCDFSPNATKQSDKCNKAANEADANVEVVDIYNIYADLCFNTNLTAKPKKTSTIIDPCSDYFGFAYLNRPDVQKALHANVTKLDHEWQPCSNIIGNWQDSPTTVVPLLKEFMKSGLRVWVFSGDTDGRVPITSTKYSIRAMNLPLKSSWQPWLVDGEVGGYSQVYKGDLTLATVRGAGHQVPSCQPKRALVFFKSFLEGKLPLIDTSSLRL